MRWNRSALVGLAFIGVLASTALPATAAGTTLTVAAGCSITGGSNPVVTMNGDWKGVRFDSITYVDVFWRAAEGGAVGSISVSKADGSGNIGYWGNKRSGGVSVANSSSGSSLEVGKVADISFQIIAGNRTFTSPSCSATAS